MYSSVLIVFMNCPEQNEIAARRLHAADVEAGDAMMAECLQADERWAAARARRTRDARRMLHRLYEGGPDQRQSYVAAARPSSAW